MKSKLAVGTMLAVALVAPAALPCGAPFGTGINADPKQDIVVVHKNGVETYVFQPRFCGSAQEFGLVLPVPAKLSSQPALSKAEVFTKLIEISQPQYVTTTQCGSPNRGSGGRAGTGLSGTGGGATVVSSGTVGFMDYAQLETSSLDALTSWLDANGYPYDTQAESAFNYYVQQGWLFLTFKVDQGQITGSSTCKDLGPVKFSFPTAIPVVPTRMATARSKDTTGVLSYGSGFSWRIFGITAASQEIGFAAGTGSTRVRNFSGLLDSTMVSALDGLGVAGDRAGKLTITFSYGSTDPDVALSLVAGQDFREVITSVTYVTCNDGGTDSADAPVDAGVDTARIADAGPDVPDGSAVTKDGAVISPPEVASVSDGPGATDVVVVGPPPEAVDRADGSAVTPDAAGPSDAVVAYLDAAVVKRDGGIATPDTAAVTADAAPSTPVEPPKKSSGGGCSFSASVGAGELLPALLAVALLLGLRRRRR